MYKRQVAAAAAAQAAAAAAALVMGAAVQRRLCFRVRGERSGRETGAAKRQQEAQPREGQEQQAAIKANTRD